MHLQNASTLTPGDRRAVDDLRPCRVRCIPLRDRNRAAAAVDRLKPPAILRALLYERAIFETFRSLTDPEIELYLKVFPRTFVVRVIL